ncbi:hypothetical protein DFH09DRAFT_1104001 [Mycena vulgaris]|nr:hypothetical protein DFH09DRAFT_1104001 [Mycena vulgaris]
MPPRSQVQTRSKSVPKQPLPVVPAPPLPASARPSVIAASGYLDRPALPAISKSSAAALHFGDNPLNTYSMFYSSPILSPVSHAVDDSRLLRQRESTRPRSSPSVSTSSTLSSPNAFAALANHRETNTLEEQAMLDLLGLSDDSFADSIGGDISSSDLDTSAPDPIKALARRLARPRPSTPPGTTSGAGSSDISSPAPPTLGCAQNSDGSLRQARDIVFFHDADDDTPLPAAQPDGAPLAWEKEAPIDDAMNNSASPFLTPIVVATAPSSPPRSASSASGKESPVPPSAGTSQPLPLLREERAKHVTAPLATTSTPQPAPMPTPAPAPALSPTTSQAAPQAAPAVPLFTTIVTRSQAARRAAAGAHTSPSPFHPLPRGMFIPPPPAPTVNAANYSTGVLPSATPGPQPLAVQPPAAQPPAQPPVVQPLAPQLPVPQPPAPQPLAAPPLAPAAAGGPAPAAGAGDALVRFAPAAAAAALGAPDALTARDNVAPGFLSKWDSLTGGKFLVYEWDGRPHSINTCSLVGPPEAANPANHSAPFMYLVRGVSDADTQLLLNGRIWNLVGGTTFFAVPYDAPSSTFIFTLDGFSFDADNGLDVADLVVSVIYEDHNAQTFLALNHDNYPPDDDPMATLPPPSASPATLGNAGGRTRIAWNVTATALRRRRDQSGLTGWYAKGAATVPSSSSAPNDNGSRGGRGGGRRGNRARGRARSYHDLHNSLRPGSGFPPPSRRLTTNPPFSLMTATSVVPIILTPLPPPSSWQELASLGYTSIHAFPSEGGRPKYTTNQPRQWVGKPSESQSELRTADCVARTRENRIGVKVILRLGPSNIEDQYIYQTQRQDQSEDGYWAILDRTGTSATRLQGKASPEGYYVGHKVPLKQLHGVDTDGRAVSVGQNDDVA